MGVATFAKFRLLTVPGIIARYDDSTAAPAWIWLTFAAWLGIALMLGWALWLSRLAVTESRQVEARAH